MLHNTSVNLDLILSEWEYNYHTENLAAQINTPKNQNNTLEIESIHTKI